MDYSITPRDRIYFQSSESEPLADGADGVDLILNENGSDVDKSNYKTNQYHCS